MGIIRNKINWEIEKVKRSINTGVFTFFRATHQTATIDETLDMLLNTSYSMSRYGDGEFGIIFGRDTRFQTADTQLRKRLREIIRTKDHSNILICIPNLTQDVHIRTEAANRFWTSQIETWGLKWSILLWRNKQYYNTQVTRLYIDYQNEALCKNWFERIRQVWDGMALLIVEGSKTKLGVNNDFFANAASVKRIIAPAKDAFSRYNQLLETITNLHNGELVLVALGPTATVLAHDLNRREIRALDIGHLDIEYEWFKMGTREKVPIVGKYVNEVTDQLESQDCNLEYWSQIVARIE